MAHIYILHTYGIPDGNIWNYYRRFILDRILAKIRFDIFEDDKNLFKMNKNLRIMI